MLPPARQPQKCSYGIKILYANSDTRKVLKTEFWGEIGSKSTDHVTLTHCSSPGSKFQPELHRTMQSSFLILFIVKILHDCCRNTNKTHSGVLPWTLLGLLRIDNVSDVFEFHSTAGHRGFRPEELV